VNKNFSDDIAIRQISQIFFINPSYLSQLFKKEVGETFTKYLMKLRIQYSCELLKDTSLNISEIAEKSGYADYFYFARVFKKVTGDTPSQFRSKNT
jgi:two-component system response regulator YesN